ncbi:MAG: rRNA maturation RNase YbeY [Anaerolineaceae bacterium]
MSQENIIVNVIVTPKTKSKVNPSIIKIAAQATLRAEGKALASLSVKITDDQEMRLLNKTYRNIDSTTDVLAFNQGYIDPETDLLYLGDIIISYEQAKLQADAHKCAVHEECALLTIHGTLHLLGYDHSNPEEKDEMWSKQNNILRCVMISGMEDSS